MASARRARSPDDAHLYAADTDTDNEQSTPKHPKQGLKKRLSEAHISEHDSSLTLDSGRPPLRSVNINDDAAEKRRRRKSTKITVIENAIAGPSSEGNDPDAPESSRTAKQKQQLNSIVAPPMINVSKDVMSSNFEEWMKMATDNKINANNSWNFALIDYFHDMSLLRNNDDNSINFQRASCTLDGCIKIWTSRVDSVGTETGKLLSNLASDNNGNEEGEEGERDPVKKKARGPAATLAKDASQLQSKKLELEFSVDPLFKKTCADFDEGGAQGLLMNHLSLGVGSDGGMRVVFDAGDSMGKVEDEEVVEEPEDEVDLSHLRKYFLPDLSVLEDKAISHSLDGFAFSKDAFAFDESTFFQDNSHHDDDDDDDVGVGSGDYMDVDGGGAPEEDFFVGDDAVQGDYGADMMSGDDYGGDNNSNGSVGPAGDGEGRAGPFVPFDPRRAPNERDLVMAMTDADGDGMMDYFDQNFMKNWAGPEHWKLRKVTRRPEGADGAAKPKVRREKKEAFKIDFLAPIDPSKDLKEIQQELFAPVTKGAGINLPGTGASAKKSRKKAKDKEKRDDHRLPDDMHFSSKQLVTLFLKPKFVLKMRGQRVRMNPNGDGEVDEDFWAQAAADQAAGRGADGGGDDTAGGGAIPFNTQFFHDDYDDGPGFDDGFDGDGAGGPEVDAGEQDLLAATQGQTRRVRPEFVNYAKRAKRVDVRKLKDNIWRGLDIVVVPPKQDDEDESMDVDETLPTPTDPDDARQFSQVISGLQKSYPREKMEEISTSFCFICLLHLANEQGLKLESTVDGPQVEREVEDHEDVKKIGNIWDLKIYRDPLATQSASL
ncbi:hypothetical protein DXG01_012372 [Tephrocybe rancida]|nr:hypothetical protein DXG01_012372 [Tephrocybe rancida]